MKRQVIIDVFTNYGYIILDNASEDHDSDWFKEDLKKMYITSYKATRVTFRNTPEYKITGPHVAVMNVVLKYWYDGGDPENQVQEYERYWVKL